MEAFINKVYADLLWALLYTFMKQKKSIVKLWVVTKISKNKERPQLGRSIVHFVNGTVFDYSDGKERPILKNSIIFNSKKGRVEFFPKKLRDPELWIKVDRFYGMPPNKKVVLDQSKRFYDVSRDRINFIVKNKDGL